jgi:hypothetical protein
MKRGLFLLLTICSLTVSGQSLEDYLSKYTSENGQMYLQPFADAFSADFNSGLFHNAKIKKKGFQLYIGIVGQVAVIPSSAKFFTATTEGEWFPTTNVPNAPTIFGPTDGPVVEDPNSGLEYRLPGGFDVDYLPLAMPQLTIGSLFGTDLTVRFVGLNVEEFGKIDLFGWGVRHSIDQYLSVLPLDLAIGYYHQSFKVGEYMDAKTSVVNLQASFNIPVITFYGGVGYESSKVDVQYTYEGLDPASTSTGADPGDQVSFNLEGANTIRATLGLCLNLGPVKLHGDYNMAKQSAFTVGLGIGINQK